MRWKVLPTEEERAIVLKLVGSEVGPDLCMKVMLETDQQAGAEPDKRVLVTSVARKWCVQGRCFRKP